MPSPTSTVGTVHWPWHSCLEQYKYTHVSTHNHAPFLPLPFWYQGRNQGQGTLAVLLGSVSGQQENLSKVRLQTSSEEGWDVAALVASPVQGARCQAPQWSRYPLSLSCWVSPVGMGRWLMLRWHSSLYAFQLSRTKSMIWAEEPWGCQGGSPLPLGSTVLGKAVTPVQEWPWVSVG